MTILSGPVVYGDLGGGGHEDAALPIVCTSGSGTADGNLHFSWVIFSADNDRISAVGVVAPRVQRPDLLATHLVIAIKPQEIIAHEQFFGPWDPTPGPSGCATTVWTYSHRQLRPGTPVITRRPTTSAVPPLTTSPS